MPTPCKFYLAYSAKIHTLKQTIVTLREVPVTALTDIYYGSLLCVAHYYFCMAIWQCHIR